jgi:hypothetical protein
MKWLVLGLALLSGCGGSAESPEERIRKVFAALEIAAEARDVGGMKPHLSESYRDAQGNDRRTVLAVATAHFMQHSAVYLLTRVSALELPAPGEARAQVLVAMAGTPIADASALLGVRADLYRFEVKLREEDGDWRVTAAEWRPATAADFE